MKKGLLSINNKDGIIHFLDSQKIASFIIKSIEFMNILKGKIDNIIKISLGDVLLKLCFNIKKNDKTYSFNLSISDDGETIIFSKKKSSISVDYFKNLVYKVDLIDKHSSNIDLTQLIGRSIEKICFGIEKTLDKRISVIYYFKILTDKNEFLFFNNGDNGEYSFKNIKEIMSYNIYDFHWVENYNIN